MHHAGNIADRYLSYLAQNNKTAPNLVLLATISLLIAAKLNEKSMTCYLTMLSLLTRTRKKNLARQELINLEQQILQSLEFDFSFVGPLPFLERYQRLLSVDQVENFPANL